MREDLYCKACAAGAPDATALTTIIADASNAEANGRTLKTAGLDVDVFSLGRHGSADLGDDVVLWPSELEAFAAQGVTQPGFVAAVRSAAKLLGAPLRYRAMPSAPAECHPCLWRLHDGSSEFTNLDRAEAGTAASGAP